MIPKQDIQSNLEIGDRVAFSSEYIHRRLGQRTFEIVDRYQDDDGDWWYSVDKRNYMGESFLTKLEQG